MAKLNRVRTSWAVRKVEPTAKKIEALKEAYSNLSDDELRQKTGEFRDRYIAGESLDSMLPDAYATVSEAAYRVLGMRPYHVQLIGGIVLHQGRIAEMRTGEGKTLVAILPAYLNAITGEGVHIVTVNDYLAKRDSEWMGKVFRYLGLTVGLIVQGLNDEQRREAYEADITYATNNEVGFDYLRDNMSTDLSECVQRGLAYAIVDEVDSILIDEARTPLIISGKGDEADPLYERANQFALGLQSYVIAEEDGKEIDDRIESDYDYVVEEKHRTCHLTARGIAKAEAFFSVENLADADNTSLNHYINQAIRAHGLMHRDIDYIVKDDQVVIVDEFTGRLMDGRRYNEGLHQAIEAKEGILVANESKTLATITFQNLFRQYGKLSGMTGTAMTQKEEFESTYQLDIVTIPTNRPIARVDHPDIVYSTESAKLNAVTQMVSERHEKGQPVLVGTASIAVAECLSQKLDSLHIPHNVLTAKNHMQEAQIIAQAGQEGAVTVATNMAGRGTDILLGGNAEYLATQKLREAGYAEKVIAEAVGYAYATDPEILQARELYQSSLAMFSRELKPKAERVRALGGLYVIGTERHESRRIDNQLQGRAGRQGDPGESVFVVSLEDELLRLFAPDLVSSMVQKVNDPSAPMKSKFLSNAIETAQRRVESKHFQARKQVLEYDDVLNAQRMVIYQQRREVLEGKDLREFMLSELNAMIHDNLSENMDENGIIPVDKVDSALSEFVGMFLFPRDVQVLKTQIESADLPGVEVQHLEPQLQQRAHGIYGMKEKLISPQRMRALERVVLLHVVDHYWMDYLDAADELRQGIGLNAYGQINPITVYKKQSAAMFEAMNATICREAIKGVINARVSAY